MFCHKCGNKSPEGAAYCQKCGAKLIQDGAATQATDEFVNVTKPISVKTPTSPAAKVSRAAQESSIPKSTAPASEGTAEICDLLKEGLSQYSKIKSVSPTSKGNAIIMKGRIYNYIANVVNGQIRLNRAITMPFTIPFAIIVGFLAWVIASIGWDMIDYGFNESYAFPLAIGLIALGSFLAILSFLGERETATVLPYIRQAIEPRELLVPPDKKQKRSYITTLTAMLVIAVIGIVMLIFIVIENFEFGSNKNVPVAEFNNSTSSIVENISLSQTYTNEDEGFLFMYPGNWNVKEESTMVAVFAPAESGYSASIAIMKSDADETYFSATMSDFESLYSSGKDNFKMLDLSDITLSGHSARKLIYTYSDNRGSYTQVQYFYIVNSDMYFVTCSSLKEHFDKYAPVFDTIMDSYTITAANSSEESGTESSYPSISYKGISISYLLGSTDDVIALLGDSPLNDEFKLRYDDMEFYHENGNITSLVSFDPSLFEANGIPLNQNRDGLIKIFGQHCEEGGEDGAYYIKYNLPECSLFFELGEHDSETWRISISSANTSGEKVRELSVDELKLLNEFINADNNYGFLLSEYAAAEEINLNEVLYNGTGQTGKPLTDKEIAAYLKASGMEEIDTDITKLTTQEINTYLSKKLGITMGEITGPFDWTYVKEFDSWYSMAGDTNFTTFTVTSGRQVLGDLLELECVADYEWTSDCRVTLRKTGEGYQFVSNVFIEIDKEYQEQSNNIDSSSLITADGNTLSVGSLVYAKQNVFGVSVNYVRGYVTAIDNAGSVSVQWDTLLENRLWAFDECAILSDSSSPTGYSYYSNASGKQIPLAGVNFNLSAKELYTKIP